MKMKKTFACLLAVLLICGIMPTGVFADETSDGETTDEPRYKVAIQLTDSETDFTDSNPYYSLEGSVYDIYKDVADPDNYSMQTVTARFLVDCRAEIMLRLCAQEQRGIATIGIITFLESRIRMFS